MNLLIPIDEEQNISYMSELKECIVITLDNGNKINEIRYKNKSDIGELIDFVVIKDKNEDVDDFLDEGVGVLVAPFEMDIGEIVEAFIFRELFELGN